jgi:predicted outer membrane protein
MTKDRLSKLSGEQFDRAYTSDMVKDHTQDALTSSSRAVQGQIPT